MTNDRAERNPGASFYGKLIEPACPRPQRSWIFDEKFIFIIRVVLAAVFIYAAFAKITKPLMFAEQIRMYRIIDTSPVLYITAIVLPWLEFLCGISLILGIFIRGSALILAWLNAVFLVVLIYRTTGIAASEHISFFKVFFDCGCGFEPTHAWKKILEDAGLFAISLILFFAPAYGYMLFRSDR
jgi:uncharacterized membrane protein YphA (DoxX/SURF4 family)